MAVSKESSAGAGLVGIAFQQDFAAEAIHEDEIAALLDLLGESQCLVDARERPFRAKRLRLELREKCVEDRRGEHLALIREGRQRLPKFRGGGRGIMETALRPSRK